MSRIRQLAAAVTAASVILLPAAATNPAGAAPAAADSASLAKVIIALDADLTDGLRGRLEQLGVTQGLELPSISAIAATLPTDAVGSVAELSGVRAVVPQRRLELHLYRSKDQIKANGVDKPDRYRRAGETYKRPGVTGKGVTVGIIDSGIFAPHPASATASRRV